MSRLALVLATLLITLVACTAPGATGSPSPSVPSTPTPSVPVSPAPSDPPPSVAPIPTPTPSAPITWSRRIAIDTIDCIGLVATIDATGRFHIAADCDGHLTYATSTDGVTWFSESIVPAIDVIETEPQVVVDGDRVYVGFNRYVPLDEGCGGQDVRHVGGFVTFPMVDGGWTTPRQIGDENDVLVALRIVDEVIHALVRNEGLFYLRINGDDTTRIQVSNVGTGSLRIGDDGVPRVAYVANDAVRYGEIRNGKVTSQVVADVDFSAGSPELVLAPGNRPMIAWTQNSDIGGCTSPGPRPADGTYVATLANGAWTTERVTREAGGSSLTLDVATGDVHVAVATDVIRHFVSTDDGGTWTGDVVPDSSDAYAPVIRVDPETGHVGIAAIGEGGIAFFLAS